MVDLDTVVALCGKAIEAGHARASETVVYDLGGLAVHGSAVVTLLLSIVRELRPKRVRFERASDRLMSIASAYGIDGVVSLSARTQHPGEDRMI